MSRNDALASWICALRARLERGDLAAIEPIDLGHGAQPLPGETTVRIMLADLRDLDQPDGSWGGDRAWRLQRRRDLFRDFLRLRELLG